MQKRNHSKKLVKKTFRLNEKQVREKVEEKKILKRISITIKDNVLSDAIDLYNKDKNPVNGIGIKTNSNTLTRILLNHIRHNNTNYDKIVHPLSKTDFNLATFKRKVNEMITIKYVDVFIKIEMRVL